MTVEQMVEALNDHVPYAHKDIELIVSKLMTAEEVAAMLHIAIIGGYDDRHRLAMLKAWQAYHGVGDET